MRGKSLPRVARLGQVPALGLRGDLEVMIPTPAMG